MTDPYKFLQQIEEFFTSTGFADGRSALSHRVHRARRATSGLGGHHDNGRTFYGMVYGSQPEFCLPDYTHKIAEQGE